jgi:hypothetical protein
MTQGAVVCIALRLAVVVAVAVDTTLARVDRRVLAAEPPEGATANVAGCIGVAPRPTRRLAPRGASRDLGNA